MSKGWIYLKMKDYIFVDKVVLPSGNWSYISSLDQLFGHYEPEYGDLVEAKHSNGYVTFFNEMQELGII